MQTRNFTDNDVTLNHLYEPSISFTSKISQSECVLAYSYVIIFFVFNNYISFKEIKNQIRTYWGLKLPITDFKIQGPILLDIKKYRFLQMSFTVFCIVNWVSICYMCRKHVITPSVSQTFMWDGLGQFMTLESWEIPPCTMQLTTFFQVTPIFSGIQHIHSKGV